VAIVTDSPEIDPYTAAFAAELRAERARTQTPFEEIAVKTGINKRTLFRLFGAERDLRVKQLILIAGALGVDEGEIIRRVKHAVKE
jgi:transcriptional regulator with XRE-family HTH domain